MNHQELLTYYRQMVLIRRFEERAAEAYAAAKIGGFLHLYIGEEAVAVGAVSCLQPQDDLITHYRDHGYALARGLSPGAIMAELYGKSTGVCKGRGGSMHLADVRRNFWGGYAIVGGHLPLAVGLALARQYQDSKSVVLCVLGDGATNIGEFHESLNLAALWRLPVVFLVENNLYGMGTAVTRASAVREMAKKACAYDIPSTRADGMDLLAVREAVGALLQSAREGGGPALLEVMTYRFRGHSMADPELYRRREEVQQWRLRDPIRAFEAMIIEGGEARAEELERIRAEVEDEVESAVRFAEESPAPAPETLYEDIYAQPAERPLTAARR